MLATLIIFAASYTVIAIGRLPGFRVGRASAAVIGATAMIAVHALTLDQAFLAVDYNTLVLLFGMMIVIAYLRISGFFRLAAAKGLRHTRGPRQLLIAVILISGVLSAFLLNDAVCLALTPLVLDVTRSLRRNPVPYLLALAMASNVGSTATITGNPQNAIIGMASHIRFGRFTLALLPVAALGLALTAAVIVVSFRNEFRSTERFEFKPEHVRVLPGVMWKAFATALGMVVLFFLGYPAPLVALVGAAILLFTRRVKPERVFTEVDWPLLMMFGGLFVIVAGVETTPFFKALPGLATHLSLSNVGVLSGLSAILSNVVSNVPAVLLLKPFIPHLSHASQAWLALAMSSTLAGNLTVLGSVANLIVIQSAGREVEVSFWDYFKVGAPLTLLTLSIGILWLSR
jgi:Na+/H+ antiporter NhaD/arsenite permease-like protein